MEHLETQVSDLRSYLPSGNAVPVVGAPIPAGFAGRSGPMTAAPTAIATQRHPSQDVTATATATANARSPISAFGSNSAHPSPTTQTPSSSYGPSQSSHPHHQHAYARTTTPTGASASGAKRKSDETLEDAAQKQQRSKRNRVRLLCLFRILSSRVLTWSLTCLVHLHSLVCWRGPPACPGS